MLRNNNTTAPKEYEIELKNRKEEILKAGGEDRIEKQHASGKMTARERLAYLLDKESFVEIGAYMESRCQEFGMPVKKKPGDGVVAGYGRIDGRLAFVAAQDFTVSGGTLGEYHAKRICRAMDMAYEMRAPMIFINDSGGARIEEGIDSLFGYSEIFYRNARYSGVIPQIAVILGPCAGGACYSPAICDMIFMTKEISKMFITGPGVIKSVIGEEISAEALGGAEVHASRSGVAHYTYDTETDTLDGVKKLLSYLPNSFDGKPERKEKKMDWLPKIKKAEALNEIVPQSAKRSYDVHRVIDAIVDEDTFFELSADYAKNIVVGFARIAGESVGIVANQTQCKAGALDSAASEKAARFIRFCDCYNIPLVTLVDVPGFFPGKEQEHGGIIRRGAKLLYAYAEANVPKVTVIMRKAFGGAYIAMNSKGIGADIVYAWPLANIAVMGAEGAVDIVFRREIKESSDPAAMRSRKIEEYEAQFMNPYLAASKGYVDDIILPDETRERLIDTLNMLKTKHKELPVKKHGNIPL